jgi:DNA-binding NarL/FixJ family response regulator
VASGQPPAQDKKGILSHRILIVDDSALIRRALRACLEEGDEWEVCGEAGDGNDALKLVKELSPDLIVLDLSMPGMNGFQLARELKSLNSLLPVLMFTSFKTPQLEKEALGCGCDAVVSKSENQQMLFDNIHRLLGQAS